MYLLYLRFSLQVKDNNHAKYFLNYQLYHYFSSVFNLFPVVGQWNSKDILFFVRQTHTCI